MFAVALGDHSDSKWSIRASTGFVICLIIEKGSREVRGKRWTNKAHDEVVDFQVANGTVPAKQKRRIVSLSPPLKLPNVGRSREIVLSLIRGDFANRSSISSIRRPKTFSQVVRGCFEGFVQRFDGYVWSVR